MGLAPRPGNCSTNLTKGYATSDTFFFTSSDWKNDSLITNYRFYYSLDAGSIYVPLNDNLLVTNGIEVTLISSNVVSVIFGPIYQDTKVLIKCEV